MRFPVECSRPLLTLAPYSNEAGPAWSRGGRSRAWDSGDPSLRKNGGHGQEGGDAKRVTSAGGTAVVGAGVRSRAGDGKGNAEWYDRR